MNREWRKLCWIVDESGQKVRFQRKGDNDRAIADYNEALRINPNLAVAYYYRGVAYDAKDDSDRAIADYNEAIRLNPNFAWAYNNRARTYVKAGKATLDLPDAVVLARWG